MTRMSTKNRKFYQDSKLSKIRAAHAVERYHLTNALAKIAQMGSSRSIDGRNAAAIAQEALERTKA